MSPRFGFKHTLESHDIAVVIDHCGVVGGEIGDVREAAGMDCGVFHATPFRGEIESRVGGARRTEIWLPRPGYRAPFLGVEKAAPVGDHVGVDLVLVSVGVEQVNTVGGLMIDQPVDRQVAVDRTAIGLDELLLVFHLPAHVVEARRVRTIARRHRFAIATEQWLGRTFDDTEIVVGVAVGEKGGLHLVDPEGIFETGHFLVEMNRTIEFADKQVGVAEAAR